jgi:glycerol kinase
MQLQADTSQRAVVRSVAPDLSALGVAGLAATTVGVRPSSVDPVEVAGTRFEPGRAADAARRRQVWADALARARSAPNVERGST